MPTCKTNPPPDQDIQLYLARLKDIVRQLNATNEKTIAIQRLDLMIGAIKSAIRTTNPNITF